MVENVVVAEEDRASHGFIEEHQWVDRPVTGVSAALRLKLVDGYHCRMSVGVPWTTLGPYGSLGGSGMVKMKHTADVPIPWEYNMC